MFSSVVVEVMCLMAVLNGALLVIQLMLTYLCASFHLATFGKMSHTYIFFLLINVNINNGHIDLLLGNHEVIAALSSWLLYLCCFLCPGV